MPKVILAIQFSISSLKSFINDCFPFPFQNQMDQVKAKRTTSQTFLPTCFKPLPRLEQEIIPRSWECSKLQFLADFVP